ncbi:MAG: hypothetical protein LBJ15_23185 [Comamonas sp.]|jgi:hypothetical protein|uniref:hypothetical protein n=1 Tax=Comamonas sp. TaxID=34028 RepID=UPI0028313F6F|nr:hypothetical protein [Comamonas sp.]MDR0216891.1 hypothetical protein [Comamonas sp.]
MRDVSDALAWKQSRIAVKLSDRYQQGNAAMNASNGVLISAVLGALLTMANGAYAQVPSALADLIGARGSSGETQMEARGYQFIKANTVRGEKWAFWWSSQQRECVQVATSDGRYSAIQTVPAANCGQSGHQGAATYSHQDEERAASPSLTLICYGEGRKPSVESRSGYRWNSRRDRYESIDEVTTSKEGFDAEVQVEISGQGGRIHLTGALVAPIHSGDNNHWWNLDDLQVSSDRITGRYALNGLNKPKVDIDRRSGRIHIDGIEHFRGECDEGSWADSHRRF